MVCIGQGLQVERLQISSEVVDTLSVQEFPNNVRWFQLPYSSGREESRSRDHIPSKSKEMEKLTTEHGEALTSAGANPLGTTQLRIRSNN